MLNAEIVQLPCLQDNYCCLIHDAENNITAVIDTPDARVIEAELEARGWQLDYILTTHHHWDHIDGHVALKQRYNCEVIGPVLNQDVIPGIDRAADDGDVLQLGRISVQVIATPGHTLGHVCYWSPELQAVFVGDTLFSMGCGRLFEGAPEQMWQSMLALRNLPDETAVYCGHEYTLSNARFAMALEPDNQQLQQRCQTVEQLREQRLPTLPTSVLQERQTNPFMRADVPGLQAQLGLSGRPPAEVFAEIRQRKDQA
ncbi:hydroxyacylglutathione hydrolase [Aliamphritea hakodatensis]|uniref:hydroxyacylglutathione hydrolase n=1 Tax=Aliamphritea hakodatensis TaxID=2895352 RepID=UPI0022FD4113|nr:hydroxyacylglutathione hydrolase [Aliamphritea hakodatensis]